VFLFLTELILILDRKLKKGFSRYRRTYSLDLFTLPADFPNSFYSCLTR